MRNKIKILFALVIILSVSDLFSDDSDLFSDDLADEFMAGITIDKFKPLDQQTINPATNSNKKDKGGTDGEIGVVGTLAGVYNKTREAVKATYDEIQYWKGLGATYGMLKDWYAEQKAKYKLIGRTMGRLAKGKTMRGMFRGTKGKDWFDSFLNAPDAVLKYAEFYTQNAENLVNQTDDFAYGGIRNLDRVFSHAERYTDALGESKITGVLMPNTDEVFKKFDELIYTSSMDTSYKKRIMSEENYRTFSSEGVETTLDSASFARQQEKKVRDMEDFVDNTNALLESAGADKYPETKVINTLKGLAASATGNSAMYYGWSMTSMETLSGKMQTLDSLFDEGKMDNIMDMQLLAAKFELEMINANNKRILHELEALKIHHAMLGYEIYAHDKRKAEQEDYLGDAITLQQMSLNGVRKIKAYLKEKYGDENYGGKHGW